MNRSLYPLHGNSLWLIIIFLAAGNSRQRRRQAKELERWLNLFDTGQWGIAPAKPLTETVTTTNLAFAKMDGYETHEIKVHMMARQEKIRALGGCADLPGRQGLFAPQSAGGAKP